MEPIRDDNRLVKIDPLPEPQPMKTEPKKKKTGRPPKTPEEKEAIRLSRKKTTETHVLTERRKQALLKARLMKSEKAKARKAEAEQKKSIPSAVNQPPPNSEDSNLLSKIGKLEEQLLQVNQALIKLNMSGTFKGGDAQAKQTLPQEPTELNQPDINRKPASYMRVSNGGRSMLRVEPNPETDYDPPVQDVRTKYMPEPFFF